MASFRRLGQSELLPRYIFAESLFARRRVLEIGAVASTLGQSARFLSTRGARVVVAADADLAAVQEAQTRLGGANLRFRPPVFDDFEGGSFDLVIVADLSTYVRAPELLKELARLVAKNGYLMGGLRNPAGLALSTITDPEEADAPPTYGQLLDALTSHFNSIEVATQSPVLGYQIAFERGEGLQVDGSLAGHSEAAYYVVLAGQEPVRNFDPTWVQLPPEPLAFTGGRLEDASRRATEWKDRSTRLKEVLATKTTELTSRESELREMMSQLESAKDGVSRLTAQLETAREAPETLRERDDLAGRIRRVEAELTVARERAIDAEGRATAARGELEAFQRAQKDSALQTLAAQELARLERARREEVATQLEDSRNRLASAYEDLRRAQEQAAVERSDHERTRIAGARLNETIASKEADLAAARDRELRLSDARTQALQAIEGLENSLNQTRLQLVELREASSRRDADRTSLERSLEVERSTRAGIKADLERESARANSLHDELTHRAADLAAVETELQATKSAQSRALRDIETLSNSERTWREIAQQTDQRLIDTTANVQTLSDQLAKAEAEIETATARARRLELDLTTVINTERGLREQTAASLAAATISIREVTDDRDALIGERDDLRGALNDLQKARQSDVGQLESVDSERRKLESRVSQLEVALADARREREEALLLWQAKEQMLQARLAEHITSLANETASLNEARAQIATLEDSLRGATEALQVAQRTSAELDGGLAGRKAELAVAQAELQTTREQLVELTRQFEQARADSEAMNLRLTTASGELERALAELSTTRADFAVREKKLIERRELIDLEKISLEKTYRDLESTAKLAVERTLDLEERVRDLSKELREAEEERRTERHEHDESVSWLRGELASERQTGAEQKALLAKQRADAITALEAAVAANKSFQTDTAQLREHLAAAKAEAATLGESLGSSRTANESNQARVGELERQLEARTAQIAALEQAQTASSDEVSELRATVERLEGTRSQLQAEVERLTALTVEHEARFAATGAQLLAVRGSSSEAATRLTATLAEVEHLKAELEESLQARNIERELLAKTERERDGASTELTQAKASATEREAEIARLTASVSALEAAKSGVESQSGALQAQLASIQELLSSSKTYGAELEQKLSTLTTELEATSGRANQIGAALETSKQEHEALRREIEAAREASTQALDAKTREAEERLASQRDEAQKTIAEREARITELQALEGERAAALETIRASLTAANEATDQVTKEHTRARDALAAELAEAKAAIGKAQSEARGHQLGKQQSQAEIERLKEQLEASKKAASESQAAGTQQTQGEIERLSASVAQAEAKGRDAQAEIERLTTALAQAEAKGQARAEQAAQEEADRVRASIAQAEVKVQESREEVERLKASAEESETKGRALAQQEAQVEIERLSASLSQAEARARELEQASSSLSQPGEVQRLTELLAQRDLDVARAREEAKAERQAADATAEEERSRLGMQVQSLQALLAQANADVIESTQPVEGAAQLTARVVALESSVNEAQAARRQAEDLLVLLRGRYGDLQAELMRATEALGALRRDTGKTAALAEQVTELQAENVIIEQERERLAQRVEDLERELNAPPLGMELENPTRPYEIPVNVPPLVEPPIRSPVVARPAERRAPTGEFEVFDLDIDEGTPVEEPEEIMLLEEEATDPNRKKPEKK